MWDRLESVERLAGARMTTTRQHTCELFKGHCSRLTVNLEFFKNVIDTPQDGRMRGLAAQQRGNRERKHELGGGWGSRK